jgi:hypothetical protein
MAGKKKKQENKGGNVEGKKAEEPKQREATEAAEDSPANPDPAAGPPAKKLSPRARVKQAQMKVLDQMENILTGNCGSAAKGNYKCAEFVLDWSGATEIRTPLSKPRKKSLVSALMRQAEGRHKAGEQDDEE